MNLGRLQGEQEHERVIQRVAGEGDAAVEAIGRQIEQRQDNFRWSTAAVDILAEIGTADAEALLMEIALADGRGASLAAKRLLERDPEKALQTMYSDHFRVVRASLRELAKGDAVVLDREEFDYVKSQLTSEDPGIRFAAVMALAEKPGEDFPREVIEGVAEAIEGVPVLAAEIEDEKAPIHPQGMGWTFEEKYYFQYIQALTRGLNRGTFDSHDVFEVARDSERPVSYALLVAIARSGDESARQGMREILQDPEVGVFRAWAARAMRDLGTEGDLPLMRRVAEADSIERTKITINRFGPPPATKSRYFPVREAAEDAIESILQRLREEQDAE